MFYLRKTDQFITINGRTYQIALVSCKLDYCNTLFTSLSIADFNKLQCVQNSLARMIGGKRKYDHITPMRKSLHWLPVKSRCMFKVLTLIYKYLTFGTPAYFSSYIKLYSRILEMLITISDCFQSQLSNLANFHMFPNAGLITVLCSVHQLGGISYHLKYAQLQLLVFLGVN